MDQYQANPQQPYPPYQQPQYAWQPPKKSKKTLWIVLACVAVFIGLVIWASVTAEPYEGYAANTTGPNVGVVYIEGTITSSATSYYTDGGYDQQFLLNTIDTLMNDSENRGLLLYIDSPGGEVLPTSELADAIEEYKRVTNRPVYAYGHNYAASGGYWLACAADEIYLNRYCTTGSIGVTFGTLLDISGLLEKYGIRVNTIASGDNKAMGSSYEEMDEEARAIFQAIIDEYFGYFTEYVALSRNMSVDQLLPLADGRIYTAKQAVSNGLADQVANYQASLDALLASAGEGCRVDEYYPIASGTLLDMLLGVSTEQNEITTLLQLAPPSGALVYYEGN